MLSKHVTKIVQNLEKKKFREKYNLFKIEGDKLVRELLQSDFKIHSLFAYRHWAEQHSDLLGNREVTEVDEKEMASISNFQSLPEVLALAEIPQYRHNADEIKQSLSLLLNGIQDPGNLGTILRVSDWFGIRHVFCDEDCASFHNPKCVQASMGAVFRVKVHYTDLNALIQTYRSDSFHCYGTFLHGDNIYRTPLASRGFIVMGNEGKGIRADIEALIDKKLTIPSFADSTFSTESLNVGVATGIILSEFKRNT
ncbi:TrmH family RNA methyltransferase [Odoribacter lunatus]|uniref:TrmH family RNA methyltransferase n=1 Tax=Odoribacter lunatus TaxID=2941335 RepID=UPI00203DD0F5|nr:RNA methyltransferase [Odoribacter lunatus]